MCPFPFLCLLSSFSQQQLYRQDKKLWGRVGRKKRHMAKDVLCRDFHKAVLIRGKSLSAKYRGNQGEKSEDRCVSEERSLRAARGAGESPACDKAVTLRSEI